VRTVEPSVAQPRQSSHRRLSSHNAQLLTQVRPVVGVTSACFTTRRGSPRCSPVGGPVPAAGPIVVAAIAAAHLPVVFTHTGVRRPQSRGPRQNLRSCRANQWAGPLPGQPWRSGRPSASAPTGTTTTTMPIAAPAPSIRTPSGPTFVETTGYGSYRQAARFRHPVSGSGQPVRRSKLAVGPDAHRVATGGQARQRRSRS
jgi:hypothetical protein